MQRSGHTRAVASRSGSLKFLGQPGAHIEGVIGQRLQRSALQELVLKLSSLLLGSCCVPRCLRDMQSDVLISVACLLCSHAPCLHYAQPLNGRLQPRSPQG